MEFPGCKVEVDTSELEEAIHLTNQLVEKIEAAKSLLAELSGIIEKMGLFYQRKICISEVKRYAKRKAVF